MCYCPVRRGASTTACTVAPELLLFYCSPVWFATPQSAVPCLEVLNCSLVVTLSRRRLLTEHLSNAYAPLSITQLSHSSTASVCLCHMCWGRDSEKPGLSSTQSKHGVDTAVDLDWFTDRHVSCFSVYMWYIIVHLYISGYCTNRVLTNFYSTIILTTMA